MFVRVRNQEILCRKFFYYTVHTYGLWCGLTVVPCIVYIAGQGAGPTCHGSLLPAVVRC